MKKLLLLLVLFISIGIQVYAQNVAINNTAALPDPNAMLDINAPTKGILIPRINYNNRPTTNLQTGLLVYIVANGPLGNNAFYFYDGVKWQKERGSDDVQTLSLTSDTLTVSNGNSVIVGNVLNLIGYYKCPPGNYVQIARDSLNCGSCGNICAFPNSISNCQNSQCILNCNSGYANCDGIQSNGCEVNLNTSVINCGICGHVCSSAANATTACVGGTCAIGSCNAGWANCDNNAANGCEINITNDSRNCGNCGSVCPSGRSCVGGVCK